MKKLKLNLKLSGFDLGVIIAAVVIALLGGGAWWYLSGALADAQADTTSAKADFDKFSSNPKYHVVVSPSNAKTLQANIDLLKAQLVPLINDTLQPKENKLLSIEKEDPVAWKHDLDDEVRALNNAAKLHSVVVPPNYYFGFSSYISQSPSDEQTAVLSKQLLGIEQIATIMINAQVKDILAIRRTYEEEPHSGSSGDTGEPDRLAGYSTVAAGGAYAAYPFEVEFDATPENFRTFIDNLIQSPYIFVVRSLSIESDHSDSPRLTALDQMAGTPQPSIIDSSPGAVATNTSTVGPQYLFGNSSLKIKARIDMIEWDAQLPEK